MSENETSTIEKMQRPQITKEIIRQAAFSTAKQVSSPSDKQELAKALCDCYHGFMDGFELGKALDSQGWNVNPIMVEELDYMHSAVRDLHDKDCWAWVKENNIEPPLPIGTILQRGEIVGIDSYNPAAYLVKPVGQDDSTCGCRRYVIKFELAQAV